MKTRSCGQEVTVLQVLYFCIRTSRFILLGAMPAQQLLPLGGVSNRRPKACKVTETVSERGSSLTMNHPFVAAPAVKEPVIL